MFEIIDMPNLFKIIEISDKFLSVSDIGDLIIMNEVKTDGN